MEKLTKTTHEYRLKLWTSRITECKTSGITVATWCDQQGISNKSYYYWMRKIKQEAFENLEVSPVAIPMSQAVTMAEAAPCFSKLELNAPTNQSPSNAAITLRLGGISVEIQDGASEATINHTLCAIGRLC